MMNSFSYDDALKLIPKARPRKFLESRCDPVLDHCMKLRKFHNEIEHLILMTANLKEVYDDSEREPILQSLPPIPEIPQLIMKTPDEKLKNLSLEEMELSDESIMKLVSKSIACVLFILGYTDMSSHLLQMLSKVIIDYVKSLIEKMVQLLPINGSISLDLLEAALQSEGINGIGELYSFYAERIVKFHDKFYLKCRRLCDDLRNNLKKPDAPPVENITESSVDELCSTDIIKEEQNNEANSKDSIKYSLDSGVLAEDIFVRKKIKRKSVRFGPQIEMCEISKNKKLLMTNIAVDKEKFPAEKSVYSESFTYLQSMLTDSSVSLKGKNSSQITGLFNNSFYYCDDEILSDSKSIICDVNKVPDKSAVSYPDYESSVQSSIRVDAVKDPDINAHGSELIDVSWDQDVNIVCDEEEAINNNTFDSEFVEESVPDEEKALNKSAIGSKSVDDSSNQGTNIVSIEEKDFGEIAMDSELVQDANIVFDKKKACYTNAVASKLTNELLNQDSDMVNEEEKDACKNSFDFELIEVSAIQDTSLVPNEKKAFNRNAIDSEPCSQDVNIAGVEKKSFDKSAIGSKSTDNLLNLDSNISRYEKRTPVNNVIDPESRSNLECVFPDNTDSSECTKHISELSCELNSSVCKHITKKSVSHSTDKPLHNHKAIRKLADLKNFGSLSDNSTGPKRKKPKLMKHKKVFENDTNMETIPTKMKDDIENCEHTSSSLDYNINSTKNLKESEENNFHNYHNPKTSLTFEDSSVTIRSSETINYMQDVSSSSENETEQIWVSL
ncbi:putative leucine-rich repeat-containing protein DDB_G0290503 [Parasteatoda tepidariorum]|uniref:putative leucine-rich repeat-containing protein DDB_G0290503 n=1 Tax=Parasteatoda tepidariorum TaxID=114398 RepID=UPI001C719478|nr:uncharacterized protein LOC107437827 [Parasteatoda tepidariorum]